jgi:hypothetical protein
LPVCFLQTKTPEDDVGRFFRIHNEEEPVEHESRKEMRFLLLWRAVGLHQEQYIDQLVRQPGEQYHGQSAGSRRLIVFEALTNGLQ